MSKSIIAGRGKWIALLVFLIVLALLPVFIHSPYHIRLLVMVIMNGILAMTFVLPFRTGLINMAIAVFWGVGAYASTALVMQSHLSFWLALPCSTIIAGILALAIGALLIRGPVFGFVIMTIVIAMLFPVVIGSTGIFGGYSGIVGIPPPNPISIPLLPPIEFTSNLAFYYLVLFLLVVVVAVYYIFYKRWTGRAWMAIGLNSQLAKSTGINIYRYRLLAFVVSCATAGLMGSFYAHFQGSILPGTFGIFKTVYVQVYALLGGIDFAILGPFIGSAIMVIFPEFMRIAREVEPIITGALLVVLIVLLPGGILSLPGIQAFAANPAKSLSRLGKAIKYRPTRRRA